MLSSALTKSVKTWSTWSSPASTAIISELGFVYLLGRTAEKKVVRVCVVRDSLGSIDTRRAVSVSVSHLQRMYASSAVPRLQTCHCAQEELSSLRLEMNEVVWSEVIECLQERGSVGLQEEELAPETLGLFALDVDIVLTRGRGSARHMICDIHDDDELS